MQRIYNCEGVIMGVNVIVYAVREVEPNSEGVPPMTMRHKVEEFGRELSAEEKADLRKKYITNEHDYLEYEITRS